jgi:hypothetical protein
MPLSPEVVEERLERVLAAEIDNRLELLLSNYQAVTANPRSMGYLRFLLKHYAKSPTPWRDCFKDNLKRFGPGKTEALCGVLKDTIRQTTYWRHGHGGHSKVPDTGAPGVAIGEADRGAAPAWGGHRHLSEQRSISLLDELDAEFGVTDHTEPVLAAWGIIAKLDEHCDVYRVLLGLDEPPTIAEAV